MTTIDNVKTAFDDIDGDHGDEQQYGTVDDFQYTEPSSKHIQGVQRLQKSFIEEGNWYVFSSSDDDYAKLAFVNDDTLQVEKVKHLDNERKHAGGIDTYENILAVPCENDDSSIIYLLDVSSPTESRELCSIDRPGLKASAAGIARLLDNRYLVAVIIQSEYKMQFYKSKTTDITGGFDAPIEVDLKDKAHNKYENINLITQQDGKVFMVGTHSTTQTGGRDWADLFTVDVNFNNATVKINYESHKHYYCPGSSTFEGGAGIYITGENKLSMYAVRRWTNQAGEQPRIKMTAFTKSK